MQSDPVFEGYPAGQVQLEDAVRRIGSLQPGGQIPVDVGGPSLARGGALLGSVAVNEEDWFHRLPVLSGREAIQRSGSEGSQKLHPSVDCTNIVVSSIQPSSPSTDSLSQRLSVPANSSTVQSTTW